MPIGVVLEGGAVSLSSAISILKMHPHLVLIDLLINWIMEVVHSEES